MLAYISLKSFYMDALLYASLLPVVKRHWNASKLLLTIELHRDTLALIVLLVGMQTTLVRTSSDDSAV